MNGAREPKELTIDLLKDKEASDSVPHDVMAASPSVRLKYFKERTVLHAKMKDVLRQLLIWMSSQQKDLLVFLFGPSGVGKSKLIELIVRIVLMAHMKQLNEDLEWLPIAVNELIQKSERYSWREVYQGGLSAVQEPLIDFKILPRSGMNKNYIPTRKPTVDRWGNAYAEAFEKRGVLWAVIDNANMMEVIPTRNMDALTNPLIGLSQIASHYLFGTYRLRKLMNLNGQIARRARALHYPRYHSAHSQDLKDFQFALNGFAKHLPFEEPTDLVVDHAYLYSGCVGCIGVLHSWLTRAVEIALADGSKKITMDHLKSSRLDKDSLRRLEEEADQGESMLLEDEDGCAKATEGLLVTERKWIEHFHDVESEEKRGCQKGEKRQQAAKKKGSRRRHPGQMNPRRIPIGKAIEQLGASAKNRGKAA